ncbi:Putative myosin heavy chain [Chlamydia avium 10DC88]|uniref:Myosin heavy chain n=1 Tax=Chlamydia avium 10DC88 TaxID=1229831 RepID=W8K0H8_9CHLA|nr:Putative myosin heavy chain [Chlamydia avium 10DC88]
MHIFNKHLYYKIYRRLTQDSVVVKCRSFSLEWVFLSSIVLLFGGLACASLIDLALVCFLMLFSTLALIASLCGRFLGYGIISCLFFPIYYYNYFSICPSVLWSLGLACSFVLSWGIFSLGISLVIDERMDRQQQYDRLSEEHAGIRSSYDKAVHDKAVACEFLEKRAQSLESDLEKCRALLQESCKKQEHMALDFQILSDQKNSWLEDYALLHNEYVRLVAGDETTSVFSWVSKKEMSVDFQQQGEVAQTWTRILQEKDMKLTSLEESLEKERSLRESFERECLSLHSRVQEVVDLELRLDKLQSQLRQKDIELEQLQERIHGYVTSEKVSFDSQDKSYKMKYLQLREQFSAKAEALLAARKELFLVRENYLTLQKQEEDSLSFIDMNDIRIIERLLEYIENLEEEITSLEELVSHTLSQ